MQDRTHRAWTGCGLALLASLLAPTAAAACEVASGARVTPLVELYTSQGCSSCPPADRWMSTLSRQESPATVSLLAFHVDYWDALGWIDRFADPAYSQRQRRRVRLDHGRTVYTPQAMVGDKTLFDWRDARRARAALRAAGGLPSPLSLRLRAGFEGSRRLQVGLEAGTLATQASGAGMLWLALYQDGLDTRVETGENHGLTLRHDRVVRTLKGPWRVGPSPMSAETVVELPEGADPRRLGLVLFVESIRDGSTLQSLSLPLADCSR